MKRLVLLALIGGALALIAWSFTQHRFCDCELEHSVECGDTRCWFRTEFGLDEPTCDRIVALHEAFRAECDRHCAAVREAEKANESLRADATAEMRAAAAKRLAEADRLCREAREAHARRVAALMPPDKAARYLEYVLPRLSKHAHTGACDADAK